MKKIGIIDYSAGNLYSVFQACRAIEAEPFLISKPEEIKNADGLILPGVGAFAKGMENLKRNGLDEAVTQFIKSGKPFFGICLGMQLLFSESEEFGGAKGLGVMDGRVCHFKDRVNSKMPVPQIMWNSILSSNKEWTGTPLAEVKSGSDFYFVHSFYCDANDEVVLSSTNYGGVDYCSSLLKENVFATQFHPEKSGFNGVKIYQSWKQISLE